MMKPHNVLVLLLCLSHPLLLHQIDAWNFLSDEIHHKRPDFCSSLRNLPSRSYTASITDFGGIGDGETLNTKAFENAISYLEVLSEIGGCQLYIPAGKYLTGSFNLTSHMTLFLDKDAVIVASQDLEDWPIIDPLPSYGRGRELPGARYTSLIRGINVTDVVITGDNGTIDGQGEIWWKFHANGSLNYTRGHLVEFMHSQNVIISNLTFINSPFWNIHPVYCSNILLQYLTIIAPIQSPNTDGIDPDSSTNVCIEDCYIENGDDLVSIKSGWDEYGIAYGQPSSNITIQRIAGGTRASSGIALGSEMSGGISNVYIDDVKVNHAGTGIRVKSAQGRGGYVKDVHVSNVILQNVKTAIGFTGLYGEHPDDNYDPDALPVVERIVIENVRGHNITVAGSFNGLLQLPYQSIYLKNIKLDVKSVDKAWNCSYVKGFANSVFPRPCSQFAEVNDMFLPQDLIQ